MIHALFCPNEHLVLLEARCRECGWERPVETAVGQLAWGALLLEAPLGLSANKLIHLAAVRGVVVFPHSDGSLSGLRLEDGRLLWRQTLPGGCVAQALVTDGERILVSASDYRSLGDVGRGMLAALDAHTGTLIPLWQATGSMITEPVLAGDQILVRTSRPELVAFSCDTQPRVTWRVPLQAWWPLPPQVAGALALVPDGQVMRGIGELLAFNLEDGSLAWRQPSEDLLSSPIVSFGNIFVHRDGGQQKGQRMLTGRSLEDGKVLWRKECKRIYAPLLSASNRIGILVRGDEDASSRRHYLFQWLNPMNGEVLGEFPLAARSRQQPHLVEGLLLIVAEDGRLLAYDPKSGEQKWATAVSSREDPLLQTVLLAVSGRVILGTYNGSAAAVQVAAPLSTSLNPQEYRARGEFGSEAAMEAQRGNLSRAAEIYADDLGQPYKAMLLYKHVGDLLNAGKQARSAGKLSEALAFFECTPDLIAQAEVLAEIQDYLNAARRFEQGGDLQRAAQYFERAGQPIMALRLYQQVGNMDAVAHLEGSIPHSTEKLQYLMDDGRFEEAARTALSLGEPRQAIDLYKQAGKTTEELAQLVKYTSTCPEQWALERQAHLARSAGEYRLEAETYERLGDGELAAAAWERAARQAEAIQQPETALADLFEKAMHLYEHEGMQMERERCWRKVVYYRHLPVVMVVTLRSERHFREMEFNRLELGVRNVGRGVAHNVSVQPTAGRFEIDANSEKIQIAHLGTGEVNQRAVTLFVRPKDNQIGTLPLILEYTWTSTKNTDENCFTERITTEVDVKARNDPDTDMRQVTYNIQGTFVQGTHIEGDQILGGGQKGDKVVVQRDGCTRLSNDDFGAPPTQESRQCLHCHLPADESANICDGCGEKLKGD